MNNKVHSAKLLHHRHVGVSFDVCDNVLSLLKAFLPNKICMYVRQPTKRALTYNVSVNNWAAGCTMCTENKGACFGRAPYP